jgi:hypothetical protein
LRKIWPFHRLLRYLQCNKKKNDMNASKIPALVSALVAAQAAGVAAAQGLNDMHGSSNLDSVMIKIRGLNEADSAAIKAASGIRVDPYVANSWPYKGYRFIGFSFPGQGHQREVAVKVAYNSLREAGFEVFHYQQMD